MRRRGIIFAASGPRYVSAAVAAADRSRTCNPVPHVIFCSEEPDSATSAAAIELFSPSPHPHADKIAAMSRSPFAETVYLDVDCAVLGSITELFDLLARYDLAGAHAPGYRGAPDPDVPVCFYEINTGVLAYRNSHKMRHFFRRWHATYLSWLAAPPFHGADGLVLGQDQPAFRHCLWHSGLAFYVLGPEYNWRPIQPSFLCERARIIHGFCEDYDRIARIINADQRARVFPKM